MSGHDANAGRRLIAEARKLEGQLQRSTLRSVARRRGVSPASLSQLRAILRLPDEILAEVERRPELARKTALAMLARVEGEEREDMWRRIRRGESSDALRGRRRGARLELSPRGQQVLDGVGRALRRRIEAPSPGATSRDRLLDFSVHLLGQLYEFQPEAVVDSYERWVASGEG
jgi:hypothetical protein